MVVLTDSILSVGSRSFANDKIKVEGEKASILDKVYIKEGENYNFELHLDTDDANANLIKTGDFLEIIEG